MLLYSLILGVVAGARTSAGITSTDDSKTKEKPAGPIVLKVVSKKEKYVFDGAGKTPKEFMEYLEELAKKQERGEDVAPPKPLPVDLVLQLENVSRENVTIHVGGTSNVHVFELTGGSGVVKLRNPVAMPNYVRLPAAVNLAPGKTYEIPVTSLADGRKGLARLVFWTGPGEYKLTATYLLLDEKGGKAEELRSEPTTIIVTEK